MGIFRKKRIKTVLILLVVLLLAGYGWHMARKTILRPAVPGPTAAMLERARSVTIKRDLLGVPHIFGKTDTDTAFGLAYAHAEDDFPVIQASLTAARGQLGLLMVKKISLANDFLARFLDIPAQVDLQYETLISPDVKVLLDAYACGLNFYAARHPGEVDSRLLPFTGKDVLGGFIHKLSLFVGVGNTLKTMMAKEESDLKQGLSLQKIKSDLAGASQALYQDYAQDLPAWALGMGIGSNSHAVSSERSADGKTRLNINSHQPWEGPVAWYEAHLVSEEGWNMIGGTFPGAPVILHGHNRQLGWAHTVNKPDGIDVYELEMHPEKPLRYKLDGEWKPLEVRFSSLVIDTGLFNLLIPKKFYRSIHGPVVKRGDRYFAMRFVGEGRTGLSIEQWYRMNRAASLEEWKAAMALQGIPMMNTMYADRENIVYVYNHLLPVRREGFNWLAILPGNTSQTLWTEYLPFEKLPACENPPSGYLVNTNSSPFRATTGPGNPDPANFSPTLGIETNVNNRARRSHELFGRDDAITREEFFRYKFDQAYSKEDFLFTRVITPLVESYQPRTPEEGQALEILKNWDGLAVMDSKGAAIANLIYHPIFTARQALVPDVNLPDPASCFREAVAFLVKHYGRVDLPLGRVQRLKRGKTDLPLAGSMDVLNAVHIKLADGQMVGRVGDSYILIAEFDEAGVRSWARHQYGNVNRPWSKHYDDQTLEFTRHRLKPSWLTPEEIDAHLEQAYHPGEESRKIPGS